MENFVQHKGRAWFDGVEKLNARDDDFIQAICDGAELTRDDYMTMLDGVTILIRQRMKKLLKTEMIIPIFLIRYRNRRSSCYQTKMIDEIPDDLSSILDDTYIKGQNNDSN